MKLQQEEKARDKLSNLTENKFQPQIKTLQPKRELKSMKTQNLEKNKKP
jgi:hypothetical protein